MQETAERFGRVDGVACTVGSMLIKPVHLTTEQEVRLPAWFRVPTVLPTAWLLCSWLSICSVL